MKFMERREAISLGLSEYCTGRPCKRGHVSQRWTKSGYCKKCWEEHYEDRKEEYKKRASEYYWNNWEHVQDVSKRYAEKNSDKLRAYWRQYYQENRESGLETRRRYRARFSDYFRNYRRNQYRENPSYYKANARKRKASIKGAHGSFCADDIASKGDLQGWRCYYCGEDSRERFHIDHKIPIALGGSNWPANICIACPDCNIAKGASKFWDFIARIRKAKEKQARATA